MVLCDMLLQTDHRGRDLTFSTSRSCSTTDALRRQQIQIVAPVAVATVQKVSNISDIAFPCLNHVPTYCLPVTHSYFGLGLLHGSCQAANRHWDSWTHGGGYSCPNEVT